MRLGERIKETLNILEKFYDARPDIRDKWKSSVVAELVALIVSSYFVSRTDNNILSFVYFSHAFEQTIAHTHTQCSQNTTNQWSALMYTSILSRWPSRTNAEADWDMVVRDQSLVEIALRNGPYFRIKAKHIVNVIKTIRARFWTDSKTKKNWVNAFDMWCESNETQIVRTYLQSLPGIGRKTAACVLLYRLRRVDFAIDTNILRIGTRLGWFQGMNLKPEDSIVTSRKPRSFARKPEGLKKFANRAHEFVLNQLAIDVEQADVETLFQAHFLIMLHGEVCCYSSKPKCMQCPLEASCPAKIAQDHHRRLLIKPTKTKTIQVFKIFPSSKDSIRFHHHNVPAQHEYLVYLDKEEKARLRRLLGLRHTPSLMTRFSARVFVTPDATFQYRFPMRGTHFLPNEVFLHSESVTVDLKSFLKENRKKLSIRAIQLGNSARSLYANTSPRTSATRVFSGKFVCVRQVNSDLRLERLDMNFQTFSMNICREVLSGLVNHVVRNEENEVLRKQRKILMRMRKMYTSYLMRSKSLSLIPERRTSSSSSDEISSTISPSKMIVTTATNSLNRHEINSISECCANLVIQVSQELLNVDSKLLVMSRILKRDTSDILKFQSNARIVPLPNSTKVKVRCANNIFYNAIVLKSRRERECICSSSYSDYPIRYDLRLLDVVPEMQKDDILSRCFKCGNLNYSLCFPSCHQFAQLSPPSTTPTTISTSQTVQRTLVCDDNNKDKKKKKTKFTFHEWLSNRKQKWRRLRNEKYREEEEEEEEEENLKKKPRLDTSTHPIITTSTSTTTTTTSTATATKRKEINQKNKNKSNTLKKKRKRDKIDESLAFEERVFVKSLNNENLRDVVSRLELNVTPEVLLELNQERYAGLKLTSKLCEGTILLTSDDVPIIDDDDDKNIMICCDRCSSWIDSTNIKTDKKSTLNYILNHSGCKWICNLCCRGGQIDRMIVDRKEALRKHILVKTLEDERIEDVIRRLRLDVTCERVLELNIDRYRGLSLKSRTREGTLFLTQAEIPMKLETKTVTHSKCICCNSWEKVSSGGQARTRSGITFICSNCI